MKRVTLYHPSRTDQIYIGNGARVRFVRNSKVMLSGESNCDGTVDMSYVVLVMQALTNPDKYGINGLSDKHLTPQGRINVDMDGSDLTVGDANAIQNKLLNK